MTLQIKRVYEPASPADGCRILVDRLWPRGLSKQDAALDEWLRELTPSTALRRWFGHDPARLEEFKSRYLEELQADSALQAAQHVREQAEAGPVTLLYAARDPQCNHALILKAFLESPPPEL